MTVAIPIPWADAVRDPDAALLAKYAADRDASAFAVLVHRHGPTVFGVCLRNAGQRQDAEDAFQAVFILLAKNASDLRDPALLGHWLYGVAYRVARKARRAALRRHIHEAKGAAMPRPEPRDSDWADVAPLLDDELMRLSEVHRTAVVLCDIQGLSRTDAAERLGIPEGTLSSRLNAARKKLAGRLSKRGVTLAVGALAIHATTAVSEELTSRLAKSLTEFHADGAIPTPFANLTSEGMIPMKAKILALVAALGLGSVGVLAAWSAGQAVPKAEVKAKPPRVEEPKPDVPKSEFNRPPRDKRSRMVGNFQAKEALHRPMWSTDGKSVMTWSPNLDAKEVFVLSPTVTQPVLNGRRMVTKDFTDLGVRLAGWWYPEGIGSYSTNIGLCDNDKGTAYASFVPGFGINGISKLTGWDFEQLMKGNQKKLWETELDKEDGTPLAISPDGKRLFTKPRPDSKAVGGGRSYVRMLDARTGNPLREIVTAPESESAPVQIAFSPDTTRVFLSFRTEKGFMLRGVETASGKTVWERVIDGVFLPQTAATTLPIRVRGGLLAITVSGAEANKAIPLIRVFETASGKDRIKLEEQGNAGGLALDISADGRFLVGITSTQLKQFGIGGRGEGLGSRGGRGAGVGQVRLREEGPGIPGLTDSLDDGPRSAYYTDTLVVWDTITGKRVRSWEYDVRNPEVAFAPDRPLLAICDYKYTQGDHLPNGNSTALKLVTNLGFWDFSGLLK